MTFEALQKKINVTFSNQELLKNAFFHRSYLNEAKHIQHSNERLEFLGDSILSFITSKFLYETYPDYHFVPIFWMASEDHDFEEIKSVSLFGKTINWETEQTGPEKIDWPASVLKSGKFWETGFPSGINIYQI